jgi:hypothetical protein
MSAARTLSLDFLPQHDGPGAPKPLREGLSAVLQIGRTLWVANDESASVERLTLDSGGLAAGGHVSFALADYLDLPLCAEGDPPRVPEVDVEGLEHDGGYLWMVGSHSLKRKKPSLGDPTKDPQKRLARLSVDANRYLIARIPVAIGDDGLPALVRNAGGHRAARLRDARDGGLGNALMEALRDDRHFADFLRIPGKDNGFDVEGLAVSGERVFLGLRGPVLRGWAAVLEIRLEDDGDGLLRLAPLDDEGSRVRKHFLALGGRGVRDMHADGDDLLILAGPTMDLDGAIAVLRWPGALRTGGPQMVPADWLQHLLDVPHGVGCDRAEGICRFAPSGDSRADHLLVVHDAAAPERQPGTSRLLADVYPLPQAAAHA